MHRCIESQTVVSSYAREGRAAPGSIIEEGIHGVDQRRRPTRSLFTSRQADERPEFRIYAVACCFLLCSSSLHTERIETTRLAHSAHVLLLDPRLTPREPGMPKLRLASFRHNTHIHTVGLRLDSVGLRSGLSLLSLVTDGPTPAINSRFRYISNKYYGSDAHE
jgi:hypothetical protein